MAGRSCTEVRRPADSGAPASRRARRRRGPGRRAGRRARARRRGRGRAASRCRGRCCPPSCVRRTGSLTVASSAFFCCLSYVGDSFAPLASPWLSCWAPWFVESAPDDSDVLPEASWSPASADDAAPEATRPAAWSVSSRPARGRCAAGHVVGTGTHLVARARQRGRAPPPAGGSRSASALRRRPASRCRGPPRRCPARPSPTPQPERRPGRSPGRQGAEPRGPPRSVQPAWSAPTSPRRQRVLRARS